MPRRRAKYLAGAVLLLCWGLVVSSWLGRIIHALAEPGYPADQTLHMHAPTHDVQAEYPVRNDALPADTDTSHAPTRDVQAEPSSPIYVAVDPAAGKLAIAEWSDLSRRWNSNSTYAGLLAAARPVEALPSMAPHAGRVIFILHTHPKMASTTLRRSCWENLRSTCNVISPKRDPVGYSNAKDLASLMQKCENTHHFCVMGWHFHPGNLSTAKPVSFFHLFPYRDFGDWAASALKQVFVGHAEAGCNAAAKRLDRCDGWLELDYAKHSKPAVARMMKMTKQSGQGLHTHHVLLYDFNELQATLEQLSRMHRVPVPPLLETKHKQTRQEGSCTSNREILAKFHGCFDDNLAVVV